MRIAITGSTGLIGSLLVDHLRRQGHAVTRVVREGGRGGGEERVFWDPSAGEVDRVGLEAHQVVIHLSGENVAGVWTERKKSRIRASRVESTRLLAMALAQLAQPPLVLITAGGIGIYGDRPEGRLEEDAPTGDGFLADVGREWEAASRPAAEAGIRVVNMRMGVVLSREGGFLAPLLPLFRLGLGGVLGSGDQMLSWVAASELPHVVAHLIASEQLRGPVNVAAPEAVTNADFTRTLARVLGRPAVFRVPAFVLRALPGGMGEEMLLASAAAFPRRLLDSGYVFLLPTLEGALRHELRTA